MIEEEPDGPFRVRSRHRPAGNGTQRQRRIYRETGNWRAVLDAMNHGWVDEIDSAESRLQSVLRAMIERALPMRPVFRSLQRSLIR